MADYNLGTLIDEVIEEAKDSSLNRARVGRYIKRTQDKVLGHQRYSFNEATSIETLSANSSTYEPDCDFQQIIQITLTHATFNTTLTPEYLPADTFFERFPLNPAIPLAAGAPNYYTHFGGTIYWSRPLSVTFRMTMRYQVAPNSLVDETDVPDVPEEFSGILFEGGMAGVERYRENHDIAGVHDREIEELSEDMLGRYGLRKRQPGKVKSQVRVHRGA